MPHYRSKFIFNANRSIIRRVGWRYWNALKELHTNLDVGQAIAPIIITTMITKSGKVFLLSFLSSTRDQPARRQQTFKRSLSNWLDCESVLDDALSHFIIVQWFIDHYQMLFRSKDRLIFTDAVFLLLLLIMSLLSFHKSF